MAKIFKPQPRREAAPSQLTVEKQAHDGRGIARHQGKTVFVAGALPGETVAVSQYAAKSSFAECQTRKVLTASAQRVTPVCEHFARCGGCSLQYQDSVSQVDFKQQNLLDQLFRQGQIMPQEIAPPLLSAPWHYRSRARLAIDRKGSPAFREKDSERFVPVAQCPVLDARLESVLTALTTLNQFAGHPITHIELLAGDDAIGIVVRHIKALSRNLCGFLGEIAGAHHLQVWLQPERAGDLTDLEGNPADPRLYYALDEFGVRLAYHPADFTQINRNLNARMVAQAIEWLDLRADDVVLDLFCGIGNFTLPLSRHCRKVIGVEAIDSMVARGRENARANQRDNCEFVAADLESNDLQSLWNSAGANTVLLDPPRAGAKQVAHVIGALQPAKILYVSCDPASLARDLAVISRHGYQLQRLGVMDMFPHTAHVESMALLVRGV